MTEYLTLEDVLQLIDDLGIGPIRDVGLLDSAVHRPQVTVFGQDAYPSIDHKAAVLLDSLVRNHALVDGNKRLALAATIAFLGLNGRRLTLNNEEAYTLVMDVASGHLEDVPGIAGLIEAKTGPWHP